MTTPFSMTAQRPVVTGEEVRMGSLVELEDDNGERMVLRLAQETDAASSTLSSESPLGRALLGSRQGEEVLVAAPRGSWTARVLSVN